MCGGLVLSLSRTRTAWISYQLGRLAGYLVLGAAAGLLGSHALNSGWVPWLSWVSTALLSLIFVLAGWNLWNGKGFHFQLLPQSWLLKLHRIAGKSAGAAGALTAFLPCGWLHTFVLGAVATQSAWKGAGFLFAFWLGTLPALGMAPWLIQRFARVWTAKAPKLSALILIAVGIASLGTKIAPLAFQKRVPAASDVAEHRCH